jgi:hypothetical protein
VLFPAADATGQRAALLDNRRAIDEANTLNAPRLAKSPLKALCPIVRDKPITNW